MFQIRNKTILAAAVSALTSLIGIGAAYAAGAPKGDPVVIGVIEDRSGSATFYSQESVKAIKLFAESINKGEVAYMGGTAGSDAGIQGRPIELIFEDDENNANLTVVKSRRLIERGADILFFLSGSGATMQGRVVCAEQKILCIAPTNVSSRLVSPPNNEYIFTMAPISEISGSAYIDAWKKLGFKRIAVISDSSPTSRVVRDAYKKTWEAAGFETVADEMMEIGSTDANSQVMRVRGQNPDVVFDSFASAAESAAMYKSLQRFGVKAQRWAQNNLTATPKIWELAGNAVDGTLVVDPIGPGNPNTDAVKAIYEKTHGKDTFVWLHAVVWDGLMLVKTAAKSAKSLEGTALRDAVEKITAFPSAFGQKGNTLNFARGVHNGTSEKGLVIVQFKNQKPSVLWDVYQPTK